MIEIRLSPENLFQRGGGAARREIIFMNENTQLMCITRVVSSGRWSTLLSA